MRKASGPSCIVPAGGQEVFSGKLRTGRRSQLFVSVDCFECFFQRASKTLVWAFGVIIFCANFLGLDGVWL